MAGKPIKIAILADGKNARAELARTSGAAKSFGGALGKLKLPAMAAAGAITGLATKALWKGLGRLKAIDEAEASLRGLGRSAAEVKDVMGSVTEAVTGTKFGLDEAASASATALAAGVKPGKELVKYLTLIGDAATLTNSSFGDMARVINKSRTLGAAYNDTLQVLGERGLPVYQMLSDKLKISTADVKKLASQGKISADILESALVDRVGGAAQESGKTFSGALANANAALGRLGAKVLESGFKQMPGLFSDAGKSLDKLGPSAEKVGKKLGKFLADAIERARDAIPRIKELGTTIVRTVVPPIQTLAKVGVGVLRFFDRLPGSIKMGVVQLAIGAAVWSRLAGPIASAVKWTKDQITYTRVLALEMRSADSRTAAFGVAMTRMAGMAKAAAGPLGMGALILGANAANEGIRGLSKVGGGALLGFAAGGPVGAAIGATAGLLIGLRGAADQAASSIKKAIPPTDEYKDSLKGLAGAATAATRELIRKGLVESGAIKDAQTLGINTRDLIDAALGQEAAVKRVNAALAAAPSVGMREGRFGPEAYVTAQGKAVERLTQVLNAQSEAAVRLRGERARERADLEELDTLLKGLPKDLVTRVKTDGVEKALADVGGLAKEYQLTPKQVQTVFAAKGLATTREDARKLLANLGLLKGVKPDLGTYVKGTKIGVDAAKREAAKSEQVGTALKSGAERGVSGFGERLKTILSTGVANAIKAAKAAADARSPSRKTMRLGRDLSDGLRIGVKQGQGKAVRSMTLTVAAIVKAATSGTSEVRSALSSALKSTGLAAKKVTTALKATTALQKAAAAAAAKIGTATRALNGQTYTLAQARDYLAEMKQQAADYAASIKDAVVASADITQLGGPFTPKGIVAGLTAAVGKAEQYADMLQRLKAGGLNATTLQQLLDAGVRGGLATAKALLDGGAATISQVNTLTSKLAGSATTLGSSMADKMHAAGIAAAQGLVKGLESQESALKAAAEKAAAALVAAAKKKLKVKSPSRVFAEIGLNVSRGLAIGVDDQMGKRAGEVLAASLVGGFGDPRLSAQAAWGNASGASSLGAPTFTIRLTAEQVSQLQRGREIQADLDAYRRAGGAVAA